VTNLTFFYLWELQRVTIFKKFKAHHDRIPAFRPPVSIALVPVAHVAWKMSMALKAPWNHLGISSSSSSSITTWTRLDDSRCLNCHVDVDDVDDVCVCTVSVNELGKCPSTGQSFIVCQIVPCVAGQIGPPVPRKLLSETHFTSLNRWCVLGQSKMNTEMPCSYASCEREVSTPPDIQQTCGNAGVV
jgi:hypothetical protein